MQKENQVTPPKNGEDMYKKILVERYGFGGTLKFMAKAIMGQKI